MIKTNTEYPWPNHGEPVQPKHREHIGGLIRQARAEGVSVGPPEATYQWNLSRLDEVIQFHPPDMILSVESGLEFRAVKDLVESERLWLPLDNPQDGNLSIGDFLAEDTSLSWLSHHYGTARDWVMKLTVAEDHGRIVKSGAALVKNVAGYLLAPLYIGAQHALGPIIDVSFRLLPLPTDLQLVQWAGTSLSTVHEILEHPLSGDDSSAYRDPWEGLRLMRSGGDFRLDAITRISQDKIMAWAKSIPGGVQPTISKVDIAPREYELGTIQPMLRIQVMPSKINQLLATLPESISQLVCYPAAGVLKIGSIDSGTDRDSLIPYLGVVTGAGGRIHVLHRDASSLLPPNDVVTNDQWMMRRIKNILDPTGVFGPLPEYLW